MTTNQSVRDEIKALQINNENTLLVAGKPIQKGSVALLIRCIDLLEKNDANEAEQVIIARAIDSVLARFVDIGFDRYFAISNPSVQKRLMELTQKSAKA